jgi:hypothetical protein
MDLWHFADTAWVQHQRDLPSAEGVVSCETYPCVDPGASNGEAEAAANESDRSIGFSWSERKSVKESGGQCAPAELLSGWFSFAPTSIKPLKRLLPELILVKADQAQSLALHSTLQLLASEMAEPAPGSEVMVNRLADILFIQCVRAHIASSSENCKSGWLRAIFDPKIGVALKAMHEKVENPWTVGAIEAIAMPSSVA